MPRSSNRSKITIDDLDENTIHLGELCVQIRRSQHLLRSGTGPQISTSCCVHATPTGVGFCIPKPTVLKRIAARVDNVPFLSCQGIYDDTPQNAKRKVEHQAEMHASCNHCTSFASPPRVKTSSATSRLLQPRPDRFTFSRDSISIALQCSSPKLTFSAAVDSQCPNSASAPCCASPRKQKALRGPV